MAGESVRRTNGQSDSLGIYKWSRHTHHAPFVECKSVTIKTNIQIYKYTNIQIYKYTNTQIYKYTNIHIYKYTKIQIYKYTNIQAIHKQQ